MQSDKNYHLTKCRPAFLLETNLITTLQAIFTFQILCHLSGLPLYTAKQVIAGFKMRNTQKVD